MKVTKITERDVMKSIDEYPKLMASIGVTTMDILKEIVDQYKDKMVRVKDTLMKERGEGQEMKRTHEATLSEFERL